MVPNEYLPSHLGEIPNHWKRVRFLDVMKVRQGLQIAISDRLKEPTATSKEYITIQSINKTEQAREYVETPSSRVICNQDDVLMTRTGNTGIVVTGVEGVFHNNFFLMDFDRGLIDSKFLVNYLRTNRVQHLILTKAGASTIPDLNHKDFYSIEFPLAPLPEQRKIAQILSTWDKAIATTEKLIEASKQQKKALMQQLLTGKKRLVDPETGKAFEGDWAYVQAGSIFATRSNKKHNSDLPILAITQDQGAVPRELIDYNVSVTQSSIAGYKVVEIGDFIISLRSFQGGIEYSKYKGICSPAYVILYPKIEISDDFYKYHLKSFSFIQAMKSRLEGIRDGKIISYKYFSEIKLPQPSLKEQQKIASVLTAADKEIELLEAKLSHFKQEKKALMQQLLTGKRRVKVAETEAA